MKINRKSLIEAVKIASKLTSGKNNNFPVLSCVMLDGAGQKLMATDLEMMVHVPLEISDYTRVAESVGVDEITGEDGVDALKGPQLKQLAEDYGIELPGKATVAVMREKIVAACRNAGVEESSWDEQFCIPAKDFGKILGTLEEDEVEITLTEHEDGTLFHSTAPRVRIGQNFRGLATVDPDEFPSLSVDITVDTEISLNKKAMLDVAIAAVKDENQGFKLNGLYFDLSDREKPAVVATDGHRLHWTTLAADAVTAPEGATGILMPLDAVKMFKSLFSDEDVVAISCDTSSASPYLMVPFGEKGGMLYIRALEARFPDWRRVVPQSPEKSVTIVKSDFQKPLEQALTITGERYSGFHLKFNGGLDVEFTNPEKGEYQRISIPIKSKNYPDDEEVLFGINGRFILDAMGPIGSEDMEIMFDDHTKPMSMRHENYHALVMPMRV